MLALLSRDIIRTEQDHCVLLVVFEKYLMFPQKIALKKWKKNDLPKTGSKTQKFKKKTSPTIRTTAERCSSAYHTELR